MSKRYKGKTCVYCCTAMSVTGDHVFARNLFLVSRRADLPKVPACDQCNGRKSKSEHYVATVLPFGGQHRDAAENLGSMVPKRLANNAALQSCLRKSKKRIWARQNELVVPTMSVILDWQIVEQWLVFIVKGLAWHHWNTLITPDYTVDIHALTPHGESVFQRFLARRAAARVRQDLGAGTFSYEAAQGIDNPQVSIWEFSVYGGVTMVGDPTAPGQTTSKIGVIVSPRPIHRRAKKKAMWLSGQPNGA